MSNAGRQEHHYSNPHLVKNGGTSIRELCTRSSGTSPMWCVSACAPIPLDRLQPAAWPRSLSCYSLAVSLELDGTPRGAHPLRHQGLQIGTAGVGRRAEADWITREGSKHHSGVWTPDSNTHTQLQPQSQRHRTRLREAPGHTGCLVCLSRVPYGTTTHTRTPKQNPSISGRWALCFQFCFVLDQ